MDHAGKSSALLSGMLACFQCLTGDASFPGLQSHCLLFFWDWHSSCPQNLFPDKAHGALVQEMHPFLNFFFALLIVLPWWCLLLASETQYLSLRERYHGQSCLIPVGSQLDTVPWNPANLNGLCGSKQS